VIADEGGRPYANPYFAGVGLGLVLLASFVVAGRGLGASGAFTTVAARAASAVAPTSVARSPLFASRLDSDGESWRNWLLLEVLGVAVGGLASAVLSRRWRCTVERGARITAQTRIALAFTGGAVMGLGAILARGCTSGQALSGGALLSVGSWAFVVAAFAAGYLVAPFWKWTWR
jgi:uncharacterized protein